MFECVQCCTVDLYTATLIRIVYMTCYGKRDHLEYRWQYETKSLNNIYLYRCSSEYLVADLHITPYQLRNKVKSQMVLFS